MSDTENYEIPLKNVRVSYPHLFEPHAMNPGDKPAYSATFLLHKVEHAALIKEIAQKMKALAAENYKDKRLPPPDKLCLRDGDLSNRAEYEGHWTLSARETTRPVVVNKDRSPLVESDDVIYAGCVVNARIRLWTQDNSYGRRVNANLLGVQFVKDGERMGGRARIPAEDMFDSVEAFDEEGVAAGDDPFG
jgi:hypothetical protein